MTKYTVNEFDRRSRIYRTLSITAKSISECRSNIIQKHYRKEHTYEIWNGHRYIGCLIPHGKGYAADWQTSDRESDDRTINPITGKIMERRY